MRLMMLAIDEAPLIVAEAGADGRLGLKPVPQPAWCRLEEGPEPTGREGQVGFQQPVQLEQRLLVEGDRLELRGRDARKAQAVPGCLRGEARVTLQAGETLFLRRGDD